MNLCMSCAVKHCPFHNIPDSGILQCASYTRGTTSQQFTTMHLEAEEQTMTDEIDYRSKYLRIHTELVKIYMSDPMGPYPYPVIPRLQRSLNGLEFCNTTDFSHMMTHDRWVFDRFDKYLTPISSPETDAAEQEQVGGDHYRKHKIQPMRFSMENGLDACQHTIIKYVTRFRDKGGIADLEKAKHTIDLLIQFEKEKQK